MDPPDADLFLSNNPVVSRAPPPQSNSSSRRKDRRVVSREVALPNSSRRSNARKLRNSSDSAANSKAGVSASHSSSSNRRSKKHSSTSTSSAAAHRSTKPTSSSSDRHHHRSSSRHQSTSGTTRSSVNDSEEHRHHSRSSGHPSSRSSRQHHHDDNTKHSDDRQSSAKSKSTASSKDTLEASKKGSHKSRVSSSSSSKSKRTQNETKDKHSHDQNNNNANNITYQVFYDEHGRKIKVPTTTTPDDTPTITDTTATPSEMIDEDCGYRSSDFDTDSDPPDHHHQYDDYSGSNSDDDGIDGASDFEEGEEDSDHIDGASELDDEEEEEEGDDDNLDEYEGEDDDFVMVHDDINQYAGESIDQDNYDDIDTTKSYDEMEEYCCHDDDASSKEDLFLPKRSNSPELNDARQQLSHPTNNMEQIVRNFLGDEIAAEHGDPPTVKVGENGSVDNSYDMDPNEDEGATLRLDRPPTPESDRCNEMGDNFSQMSVRGRDPPEEGRGCDPPFVPGTAESSNSKRLEPRHRKSAKRQQEQANEKMKPAIKGILKKKEGAAPPPLAFFGGLSNSEHDSDSDVEDSMNDSGSDPDFSEVKSKGEAADDDSAVLSLFEDKSVSTTKSGLRSGRFAEANAAAAAAAAGSTLETIDDDDSSSDEEYDHDYSTSVSTELRKRSNSVDLNTSFPSLLGEDENQFDRNKSHFMRTSDLGLTQDTIFAEQFLDDPESKPEPHYHHPSPHPPPGVQFNCDENWISVDDGFGGHSPIAPQAVDALVATGYRTACDPMMWTPTSKTRKFMTENGLRFDDIPTPAPPEEEGGRGDSSCLVWSGKFPHKHHGHDLPVIRSQGVVNMSPENLVDLLMDSTRVKSYNVSSTGRQDELILSDGTNLDTCPFSGQRKKKLTGVVIQGAKIVNGAAVGFAEESDNDQSDDEDDEATEFTSSKERRKSQFVGVTKLVRSTNKVPMRKSLEYVTLLHCRALTDEQGGNGYIIVGRACTPAEDEEKGSKEVQRAEILLNVHIIRRLREKKSKDGTRKKMSSKDRARSAQMRNRCLMINVVHVKSPIIPNMLAKKVSLSAASSFVTDIRALTEE